MGVGLVIAGAFPQLTRVATFRVFNWYSVVSVYLWRCRCCVMDPIKSDVCMVRKRLV